MNNVVKILSIDGGGIRGIIPAMLLAEIEKRTGAPIAKNFDLIAGTSTGGILALMCAVPGDRGRARYAAQDMVELYANEGHRIFSRTLLHRLVAVGNLHRGKYSCDGLISVLKEYLGDSRLRDVITDVLITSYDIERRCPLFFKSWIASTRPDYDFALADVARSTSAAPTYFEPMQTTNSSQDAQFALIDGGVFANNPAACAFVEAVTRYPRTDTYIVVSLGTGALTEGISYAEARNWGLAQWAMPLLDIVFQGVNSTVDYQLRQLLPDRAGGRRYFRFQPALMPGQQSMDNVSPENISSLKAVGAKFIADNNAEIEQLCATLRQTTSLPRTG